MIDLSRLPAPLAIEALDANALKADFLLRFVQFWDEQRLVDPSLPRFEVTNLEANPASVFAKAWAYLRLLDRARVNDAVRAGFVAFAGGADLEHLAAFYAIDRRTIQAATASEPAVAESDIELRRRVLLAPEAFSNAGTHGAYVFHALGADVDVLNVDVWSPAPGEVSVAVQSRYGDGAAPPELVERVRAHLFQPHIKPLTDVVFVRSVDIRPYRIEVQGFVPAGPDPSILRTAMERSLRSMAADRRTPSRDVPRSAITAAAHVELVDRVVTREPASDIAMGRGEVAVLEAIAVTVISEEGGH